MDQSGMYTLRDLYNDLDIPLTELSRRTGISDVTLAKIRDGASARRSTINSLLREFSQIYRVKLSTDNVQGIIIKDKLARAMEMTTDITEKAIEPPIQSPMVEDTAPKKKDSVEPFEETMRLVDFASPGPSGIPLRTLHHWIKRGRIEVTSGKRSGGGGDEYFISPEQQEIALEIERQRKEPKPRKRKSKRFPPEGCRAVGQFAKDHGVDYGEMQTHILIGKSHHFEPVEESRKEKLIVSRSPQGDYLTRDDQHRTINFWRDYNVNYTRCKDNTCICQKVKLLEEIDN